MMRVASRPLTKIGLTSRDSISFRAMGSSTANARAESAIPKNRFREVFRDNTRKETVERVQKLPLRTPNVLTRASAVLVSLCVVKGVPSLLYTLRAKELKNHSGQVSFPGGRCDSTDHDVIHAAMREAYEEIGISQSTIDVWTVMPPIGKTLDSPIYPVVGNLGHINVEDLNHNKSEVSMIFTVPLEFLCNPVNYGHTWFRHQREGFPRFTYAAPVFLTTPRVWGLTATITELFLSLMFPDLFSNPVGKFLHR